MSLYDADDEQASRFASGALEFACCALPIRRCWRLSLATLSGTRCSPVRNGRAFFALTRATRQPPLCTRRCGYAGRVNVLANCERRRHYSNNVIGISFRRRGTSNRLRARRPPRRERWHFNATSKTISFVLFYVVVILHVIAGDFWKRFGIKETDRTFCDIKKARH